MDFAVVAEAAETVDAASEESGRSSLSLPSSSAAAAAVMTVMSEEAVPVDGMDVASSSATAASFPMPPSISIAAAAVLVVVLATVLFRCSLTDRFFRIFPATRMCERGENSESTNAQSHSLISIPNNNKQQTTTHLITFRFEARVYAK